MKAKVQLILGGVIYTRKNEHIECISKDKKFTTFERFDKRWNPVKKKEVLVGRKFKVSNDLIGLYFN